MSALEIVYYNIILQLHQDCRSMDMHISTCTYMYMYSGWWQD